MTLVAADTVVVHGRPPGRGWLETDGGEIVAVGLGEPQRPADVDLAGTTLVPGFVDMHVHGGGGGSYTSGDTDEAVRALTFHGRHGTTSCLASLVTANPAELMRAVVVLSDLVQDGLLRGIHLEGPWLNASRAGAHDRSQLRAPDPREIDRLIAAGRGTVRMATLAPELTGGLDAVRRLVDAGVVAAIGHTEADYSLTREAIEAGVRVGTHIFNAMRPIHHREPGPVLALLEDGRTTVELVLDGVHVHPALLRLVAADVGASRVALVTDAMAAAGMPDGSYLLGSLDVTVTEGKARLAHTGTIAGSTATMDALFRHAVATSGLPLPQGLIAAVEMTSSTPARTLGLGDVGTLEPGRRADLVLLDAELHVARVMARGQWVQPEPTDRLDVETASAQTR